MTAPQQGLAPGDLLLVRADIKACNDGAGKGALRSVLRGGVQEFRRFDADVLCSSLQPLSSTALRQRLGGRGYVPGGEVIPQPSEPFLENTSGTVVAYKDSLEVVYLRYSDESIAVTIGSYGNRSGAELAHTYYVAEGSAGPGVRTIEASARGVDYDAFPDWW